jgi:nicotinate-nucleotide pyrophosphorylase (carboxylating)
MSVRGLDRFAVPYLDDTIAAMLAEDLGVPCEVVERAAHGTPDPSLLDRDVTTSSVVPDGAGIEGRVVARGDGVVCGLPLAQRLLETLAAASGRAGGVELFPLVAEGADAHAGEPVAEVSGDARIVLAGERSALDGLMTLSGIATAARAWQREAGDGLEVVDTRKTLPGLRALSKYAVRVGGAHNHREGLWDMVLVKDNHVAAAGGIADAVDAARARHPQLAIEVEADTVAQAVEAAEAGADIVLLDNMDDETLSLAVAEVRRVSAEAGRTCLTEASGGVTFERLPRLAATGVDRVSASAITLAPPLDFGLDVSALSSA